MGAREKEALVEHVFRHEYGKIVSILVHKFGPTRLETVEDGVQEALIKAMQLWGYKEPPQNPTAWLLRVASNKIIDNLRRGKKVMEEDIGKLHLIENLSEQKDVHLKDIINDSQLKMIFSCCHPALSSEHQIILSLRLIGGFGNKEIARALLKKEETVAKSFTRAKRKLQAHVKTLDIPIELGLKSRLSIVLKIIYLLFSEGYATSSGEGLIKKDICMEAIRLASLLTYNKYCNQPEVHSLLALMCLHTARFDARIDDKGDMVDLEHQDRKMYNGGLTQMGIKHLERAQVDKQPSNYHLQAVIAYYHTTAVNFGDTDWKSILHLYDLQLLRQYSPIIQLNRIVPFYKVHGPKKALKELEKFEKSPHFIGNALFYAIKGELLSGLKDFEGSKIAFKKATDLTQNKLEKRHLTKKLKSLETKN